ncbi:MAG TPA: hypothetical protein VF271_05310 [Rhodanobacteraceae bacterium]
MNDQTPYTYRFRNRWGAPIALGALILLFIAMAVVGVYQGDGYGIVLFCLVCDSFLFLVGGIFVISKADIVIGCESISRKVFGVTFSLVRWGHVSKIKVFPVRGPGINGDVVGYNISSSIKRAFMPGRVKIYFTNQKGDVSCLIKRVNERIKGLDVNVECVCGDKVSVYKLIPVQTDNK